MLHTTLRDITDTIDTVRSKRMAINSETTYGAQDCIVGFGRYIFRHLTDESTGAIRSQSRVHLTARDEDALHRVA